MYNTPSEIVMELARTSSRTAKENLLQEVMMDDSNVSAVFVNLVRRAFNSFETYGVKKVPNVSTFNDDMPVKQAYEAFNVLLDDLASRKLSGNMALMAIEGFASHVNADDWTNFYSNVLQRDMRCGVNVSTWNKVAKKIDKGLMVDVFSCQLAHDGAKLDRIGGEKFIEVKLDGVRVISIVHPDGTVDMFSRTGKRLDNFPQIKEELSQYALHDTPFVLDGEVMSSSFQDLMKQVNRKEDVQTDDACLYLFDIVSYRQFRHGKDTAPQRVRTEILKNSIKDSKCVRVVRSQLIDLDSPRGQEEFARINKWAIDKGYEGIMLKDPEAPYETKRTKSWLKIKPRIEVTLEVVDFEQGTGKNAKSLGALVCRGTDSGREIAVNVGSGFSDALRDDIWSNKGLTLGMEVEVYADAITQNQDGTYSLRFPRFKCFRGFEPGEKL